MLVSDVITNVKSGTLHDSDDQVSPAQYLALVSDEYRLLRRWLCNHAPSLCEYTATAIAVTGTSITKSSTLTDFEKVVLVSRLEGSTYYPISTASRALMITPPTGGVAGTYEVAYLKGAPASITTSTAIDLPSGLEVVLQERCCAWVRQRMREMDAVAYHQKRAADVLVEATSMLKGRGGEHGQSGLRREFESSFVWFETPSTLEIRKRWR